MMILGSRIFTVHFVDLGRTDEDNNISVAIYTKKSTFFF
jgi:hypothetical protein